MSLASLMTRVRTRVRRDLSDRCARRTVEVRPAQPIISFTFDDFPRSSLPTRAAILKRPGFLRTYYVSLGLMDSEIPAGRAFSREDLRQTIADGHELGCHTFAHCHSWSTSPAVFEDNIVQNQRELSKLAPGAELKSLSYPISAPLPGNKQRVARHFLCARGGGPSYNLGATDANNLQSTFIEKLRDNPAAMMRLIEENRRARGWLIFSTHDVTEHPTPFGCTPQLFEDLVRAAKESGARVVPVGQAWEEITSEKGRPKP